jgi:hypothetical protein
MKYINDKLPDKIIFLLQKRLSGNTKNSKIEIIWAI